MRCEFGVEGVDSSWFCAGSGSRWSKADLWAFAASTMSERGIKKYRTVEKMGIVQIRESGGVRLRVEGEMKDSSSRTIVL